MNRNLLSAFSLLLCSVFMFGHSNTANAQEWYQGRTIGIYSFGIGGADGIGVGNGIGYDYATGRQSRVLNKLGFSINASGEYKVWKWIGVGWESGINIYPNRYGVLGYHVNYPAVEIPFIAKANFHILDATSVSIKNKLDVYAGLQVGGGPYIFTKSQAYGGNGVYGVIHVGPQVGVRYWITNKVGVFGEFGWGATFVNAGVTI